MQEYFVQMDLFGIENYLGHISLPVSRAPCFTDIPLHPSCIETPMDVTQSSAVMKSTWVRTFGMEKPYIFESFIFQFTFDLQKIHLSLTKVRNQKSA